MALLCLLSRFAWAGPCGRNSLSSHPFPSLACIRKPLNRLAALYYTLVVSVLLEQVNSFVYLGLLIHANPVDTKLGRMQMARLQAAKSAAYAFVSTARAAGLHYSVPAYLRAMQSVVVSR